jgi:putative addiction module component (TIGR02574 family)
MTPDVSELLKKALALPPEARAALAGSLLESLDDTVDSSAEEEWSREIARRIEELDSGKVKPVPWAEARRQISAFLPSWTPEHELVAAAKGRKIVLPVAEIRRKGLVAVLRERTLQRRWKPIFEPQKGGLTRFNPLRTPTQVKKSP